MTRLIKSLLGIESREATPEEMEAYRVANEALQYRVQMLMRQPCYGSATLPPTTDAYGRALH